MKFIYPTSRTTRAIVFAVITSFFFSKNVFSQATVCASTFVQCPASSIETFTGSANGFTGTANGFVYSNNALRVASTNNNASYVVTSRIFTLSTVGVVNVGFTTAGSTANIGSYNIEVLNAATNVVIASCATATDPTVGPICYTITDNDLTLNLQVRYRITIGTAGGSNNQTLVFDNFTYLEVIQSPLPIGLINFSASRKADLVSVTWVTTTETNNRGFEVQRKTTGSDFQTISFVPSKATTGNSAVRLEYEFNDPNNFKGNSFYRLKQIDYDGKAKFSDIGLVNGDKMLAKIVTYPNPVNNKLTVEGALNNRIRIIDINGRSVIDRIGKENISVIDVSALASGIYSIKVSDDSQVIHQSKVVKQ